MRFLAKIAHAWTVAKIGIDSFEPCLPNIILAEPPSKPEDVLQFVGGGIEFPPIPRELRPTHTLYDIALGTEQIFGVKHTVVAIRLFSSLPVPTYQVVTGRCLADTCGLHRLTGLAGITKLSNGGAALN
jgi:hypothetical protein